MSDLEALFRVVDTLEPAELNQLNAYIQQRRRLTWWVVPSHHLRQIEETLHAVHADAESLTEDEINAAIDEALNEVRRERDQGDY